MYYTKVLKLKLFRLIQFIRYTQHIYTYEMRRNKHNIQTYYRTRLFGLKNDNDKEKKIVRSYKAFVTDLS